MADWTAGYVADIGYTFGYYPELNPLRARLAFLNSGLVCPEFGSACELGFGQGMSVNLHAAASVTQWSGTDFNPGQAGFAQSLARSAGSSAQLFDESFAEFAKRPDLPDFDYIGMHGIWSWISDENRAVIVDFVARKLKVGGVLYISYNTQPGWAAFAPMRHLMTQHAQVMGAPGQGIVKRIDGALDFADNLLATNPLYGRANPLVAERIKKLKEQSRHYLAHEYFNQDWHPMHFADMGKWLAPAKLQYACSANFMEHIAAVNLSDEQQQFLAALPDATLRESTRDFMVNQQFRRDYWVKGARTLTVLERAERLRQHKVVLITPRADVSLTLTGALGEATMSDAVYQPILDLLADHKPRTLGQIELVVLEKGINLNQILEAAMVLSGTGVLGTVQDDALIAKGKKSADRLNAQLMNMSRGSTEMNYLASAVLGGGMPVNRFDQLFLLAAHQGAKQPAQWAQFVWQTLQAQGQLLKKEGQTLATEAENLAELTQQATEFAEKRFPIFKALQIA